MKIKNHVLLTIHALYLTKYALFQIMFFESSIEVKNLNKNFFRILADEDHFNDRNF